jgi:hypothetical protein
MKTILISREDLQAEPVRVIYPMHAVEPHYGARDFIALVFTKPDAGSKLINVNLDNWGIGDNDGEVWTIDEIVKARTNETR